jgi:hypothetical protein
MSVRRRIGLKILGALVAVVAIAMIVLLPRAAIKTDRLTPTSPSGATVRGAVHIHSVRSDGSGTVDEIAAAASRAGLQFIIVTDHGDGTREPDPPSYRSGVLTIDAVELTTTGGHYAALGLPATPYPFAGAPEDVIEDVHRLGGFGIAAHPGSPRPSLSWQSWDAGFDGLEWINADSEWRDESWWPIARTLFTFPLRAPESVTALLDRPEAVLAKWDEASRKRRVIAVAGADAHARLGLRARTDPDFSSIHVPLPGYETSFRVFSNHVVLDGPLTGNPLVDAPHVLDAIRQGSGFTVIDGLATPGDLQFSGFDGTRAVLMGEDLVINGPATLRARMSAPPDSTLILLRDGRPVRQTGVGVDLNAYVHERPGVYRVEVHLPAAPGNPPVPWIVSNPIYVGFTRDGASAPVDEVPRSRIPARIAEAQPEFGPGDSSAVTVARSGAMAGDPPAVWTFALSPGTPRSQFAAIQIPITGGLAAFDRVRLTVGSERPMRVWAQLRVPGNTERWGRTLYTDEHARTVDLRLEDFRPMDATFAATPPLDKVDSLLFVVDTVNTRPGGKGTITISNVAFVR